MVANLIWQFFNARMKIGTE